MDDIGPLVDAIDSVDAKYLPSLLSNLIRDFPHILECVQGDPPAASSGEDSSKPEATSSSLLEKAMLSADAEGQRSMLITVSVVFPETQEALKKCLDDVSARKRDGGAD